MPISATYSVGAIRCKNFPLCINLPPIEKACTEQHKATSRVSVTFLGCRHSEHPARPVYLPARHVRQPDHLTHDKNSNRRHSELPSMSRARPVHHPSTKRLFAGSEGLRFDLILYTSTVQATHKFSIWMQFTHTPRDNIKRDINKTNKI